MALAQFPLVFLLATKNNILASLLGRGYEKLNFLHRWSGRGIFLAVTIHGAAWIRNHLKIKPAALKEEKEMRGMFAYGTLCFMVLLSLSPVRNYTYQLFFFSQWELDTSYILLWLILFSSILGSVTFFVLVCHHTPYAAPWIYPPLAFYAFDLFVRLLRFRFKTATLSAEDHLMTLVSD